MTTQIFLANPGSVPSLGQDSVALATAQPLGRWLAYSTSGRGDQVLTVTYKTNAARTAIYRYDMILNPPVQTISGQPIYVVTSTGRSGKDQRTIVTEIVGKPIIPALLATVTANSKDVNLWCGADTHGPFMYNGRNHRADTPTGAGAYGPDPENYVGAGDLPSFWCTTSINYGGNYGTVCCPPVGSVLENQPKPLFYAGPWASLSITQAEFYEMAGAHTNVVPAKLAGITYLDNNNIAQDRSGAWALNNRSGQGLLYADGDVTINGDFTWRGLIYVEGKLQVNANTWVLGGVVSADPGQFEVKHVRATFLYSRDAIAQSIGARSKTFYNLSWRETR
jgi:hypothetical protein